MVVRKSAAPHPACSTWRKRSLSVGKSHRAQNPGSCCCADSAFPRDCFSPTPGCVARCCFYFPHDCPLAASGGSSIRRALQHSGPPGLSHCPLPHPPLHPCFHLPPPAARAFAGLAAVSWRTLFPTCSARSRLSLPANAAAGRTVRRQPLSGTGRPRARRARTARCGGSPAFPPRAPGAARGWRTRARRAWRTRPAGGQAAP
mmetsp:Transcript_3269/g.7680  ORF Transcript_3269/g.7680 Transcript_3269/m.7680 type:complete len:202 (-) Transcript_3269:796-1401(-)